MAILAKTIDASKHALTAVHAMGQHSISAKGAGKGAALKEVWIAGWGRLAVGASTTARTWRGLALARGAASDLGLGVIFQANTRDQIELGLEPIDVLFFGFQDVLKQLT